MASLQDFQKRLGFSSQKAKTIDTDFDGITVIGMDHDVKFDPQRASRLQSIYTAIKGSYEKNRFRKKTKKQAMIAIFNKLADRLNECERKTGEEIDNGLFVVALFRKYKRDTFPGHLLGKDAIHIYHEKLSELCYQLSTPNKNSDLKLLEFLCEVRKESQDEVMLELKNAGIFSPTFINKWKATHKRRI